MRLHRRRLLQLGAASALGLSLPQLLRAEQTRKTSNKAGHVSAKADHCIVLFLNGGPSHHDMWDMKPDAPAEIRGEFKPVPSSLAGVPVCEHLPKLARWMHRTTLVRSMNHSVNNAHAAGVYCALTGHDRGELGGGAKPDDYPAIGSVLAQQRPPLTNVVPYVSLPYITAEGAGGPPQPGFFGGFLGKARDPLFVLKDPNNPSFALPELSLGGDVDRARFDNRKELATSLSAHLSSKNDRTLSDMDNFRTRAYDLLTAPTTREAFRIEQESPSTRDRYGRNIYGQSVLLARRLIEAGTRLTCISWAPDANATWDTHGQNFAKLKGELLPQLDSSLSALFQDLDDRGLFDRTLVVVMGEFGRTPKINANAGRDHWNFCYSLLMAGGGMKQGYVHGASDKIGAYPSLNPLKPADIIATVYEALGIDPDMELKDRTDRPYVLVPWGKPVPELMV